MYLKFSTVKDTIDKLKKLYLKFFEVPMKKGRRQKVSGLKSITLRIRMAAAQLPLSASLRLSLGGFMSVP
ncbi:hypothetical protein GCAAIG_13615 [Candidatus Electronema halotolerans]